MAIAATFFSPASFSVPGDLTAEFAAGVRILADCGPDGLRLGTVTGATASDGATTVTLQMDAGPLTANLAGARHGNDVPDSLCNHAAQHAPGGRDPLATASIDAPGLVELATTAEGVAGADAARVAPVAVARQQFTSWLRDALGEFPGLPRPTFNLYAPSLALPATAAFSRASTATRINAAGLVAGVAMDALRFDHDPLTGLCRGLLIEGPVTNSTLYSEAFHNAVWTKTRASITADAATAPDGAATADKLVEDATASNNHYIASTASFVAGSTYTISWHMKAAERVECNVAFPATCFPALSNARFHCGTGNVIAGSGLLAYRMDALPDGNWRVSITATATTSGSGLVLLFLVNGTSSYTGDGASGLHLWGAQLEEGPYPTSYLPTAATAVTRAADLCTANLADIGFNPREGTLFVDARVAAGLPLTAAVACQIDSGLTENSRIRFVVTPTGLMSTEVTMSDASQCHFPLRTLSARSEFKAALSWRQNDFKAACNGGSVFTSASGSLPSDLTTLRMGGNISASYAWNGVIRHLAYFPRALSSEQLQAITL